MNTVVSVAASLWGIGIAALVVGLIVAIGEVEMFGDVLFVIALWAMCAGLIVSLGIFLWLLWT